MVENLGAGGKKQNYLTTRTSEGGQYLERANPDSSVSDPAETMVSPRAWTPAYCALSLDL